MQRGTVGSGTSRPKPRRLGLEGETAVSLPNLCEWGETLPPLPARKHHGSSLRSCWGLMAPASGDGEGRCPFFLLSASQMTGWGNLLYGI